VTAHLFFSGNKPLWKNTTVPISSYLEEFKHRYEAEVATKNNINPHIFNSVHRSSLNERGFLHSVVDEL
jgi:hypothetical protein